MQRERWHPNRLEMYYYINELGGITSGTFMHLHPSDRMRVAFGNCFPTEEAAVIFRNNVWTN